MFQNYILIALRNLFKHKLYSLINIGGLAIGLTAVILIGLFVRYETSYDKFWENSDRVYRANITFHVPGRAPMEVARTPGILLPTLLREMPGSIKYSSRIMRNCYEIRHAENVFTECADFVDPEFLELFNFEVVAGNAAQALADNSSIMIAESIADKYFGNRNVLGQTLIMNEMPYTVVAIMKNIPLNSHINSDMIGRFDPIRFEGRDGLVTRWTETSAYSYVMLADGQTIEELAALMPAFLEKNVTFTMPGLENMPPSELMEISYTKVSDIHLMSSNDGEMTTPGNLAQVYTFSGIALMVLLIATINFMNLSSARATQRAREVSMRKVMGATRKQLIVQFLGEAVLMTLFGLLLAIAMVELLLPLYSELIGTTLSFDVLSDMSLLASMVGLVLVIGILGGLYPAFVLSGFRPALVLHSSSAGSSGSLMFRNVLVMAQFSITIGLMIMTGVIYGQTVYAANMDLGFEKENRLILRASDGDHIAERYVAVREEFSKMPGVVAVTFSSDSMPRRNGNNTLVEAPGAGLGGNILVETLTVGYSYFQHYGIVPIAGRTFSQDFASDEYIRPEEAAEGADVTLKNYNVVINAEAVGLLGFSSPEDALNKQINVMVGNGTQGYAPATIVGVIPNVLFKSAREDITPMIFNVETRRFYNLHIKVRDGEDQAIVEALRAKWQDISGTDDARVNFVETNIDRMYRAERLQAVMFVFFAVFAIFVACLGLFGMANFTAERRTREIGIRKVHGARVFDIVRLLVVQASKPVIWANVVAWPIAGYFVYDWLQGFTERLGLGYLSLLFVSAATLAILIAWATISVHAVRVARSNPIHALRVE